ncbi:HEXXH motif-containing putative peptide modification protein [Rhizobium puerariae]|uniref:HEXXH motif-containing putative peptide modification protein n=1 Tax=Rhizobium puerariae TaxID=1585791 RepID=A0ABV6ACA6_9HYPH
MSASHIDQLPDQARMLLRCNPLLSSAALLETVVGRSLSRRRDRYARTLAAVYERPGCRGRVEALAGHFPDLAEGGYRHADELPPGPGILPVKCDPYRSSALAAWMDGLQLGLEWLAHGANAHVLDHYLRPDLVAGDLATERRPDRQLACGMGLVDINRLMGSRVMPRCVARSLPDYLGRDYLRPGEADLDRIADHLDKALALAAEVDPKGCDLLVASLHTLHVGLRHDPSGCLYSFNGLPGSLVVVFSTERLDDGDHAATAAQLLHEAGHILLGLNVTSAAAPLPGEFQYVAPDKNDLQTLESILHTAYTIPWECAVRMACLPFRARSEQCARETALIIAYAARQIPLIDIAREGIGRLGGDVLPDLRDIAAIPSWSAGILALVDRLLEHEPPARRQAHYAERQRVLDHQAWATGQMLLRGKQPVDPRLGRRELDRSSRALSLWYDGRLHVMRRAGCQPGVKDYGRHIQAIGVFAGSGDPVAG